MRHQILRIYCMVVPGGYPSLEVSLYIIAIYFFPLTVADVGGVVS